MPNKSTFLLIALLFFTAHISFSQTAPAVTLDQAANQADPTTVLNIEFTARFSEPVSGFESTDVSFSGSTAGVSVAKVFIHQVDASRYRVIITNITHGGQIQVSIPANSVTDAEGTPNAASTATDNSVTYNPRYVTVGGKVRFYLDGKIIRNANLELILPSGERRYARSNAAGYYRFDNVQTANLIIIITSKNSVGGTVSFNLWDEYPNLDIQLFPR